MLMMMRAESAVAHDLHVGDGKGVIPSLADILAQVSLGSLLLPMAQRVRAMYGS